VPTFTKRKLNDQPLFRADQNGKKIVILLDRGDQLAPEFLKISPNGRMPAIVVALNAVLLPIEGNRWMVLVANRGATTRPETWESFLEACRLLITPTIYNPLRSAKPPDDIPQHSGQSTRKIRGSSKIRSCDLSCRYVRPARPSSADGSWPAPSATKLVA
jgi:hypothetical protein